MEFFFYITFLTRKHYASQFYVNKAVRAQLVVINAFNNLSIIIITISDKYTIQDLKDKWKNLYDTFKAILAKEKLRRSGDKAEKKKPPWRFYQQMLFLKDMLDTGAKK